LQDKEQAMVDEWMYKSFLSILLVLNKDGCWLLMALFAVGDVHYRVL